MHTRPRRAHDEIIEERRRARNSIRPHPLDGAKEAFEPCAPRRHELQCARNFEPWASQARTRAPLAPTSCNVRRTYTGTQRVSSPSLQLRALNHGATHKASAGTTVTEGYSESQFPIAAGIFLSLSHC